MTDIRAEIREAFEREQSPFPPHAALRAQVAAAISAHARAEAPTRRRTERNVSGLMTAAAALLAIAIVVGLMAGRLIGSHPIPVNHGPKPQLCVPGATNSSSRFALIHGCITYVDGQQIVAVDPYHPANRTVFGPSNGQLPLVWSRDGNHLLLGSTSGLYVMNADGSEVRVAGGDAYPFEGSFSPDGTKVVYVTNAGVQVVDVRGGASRLIAASNACAQGGCPGDYFLDDPVWSPDGQSIVVVEYRTTDEIWSMNSDGSGQRRLLPERQCEATQPTGCTTGLAWSPDGSQLAFHSLGGIYVMRRDGSGLHRITNDGVQPSWSPDGSRIGFLKGGGELFTMAPDGSDVVLVAGVVVAPQYGWAWNPGVRR